MDEKDKAYIAGFFDGEGSAFMGHPKAHKNGKRYNRLEAKISQNSREVLDWIAGLFGFGRIYARGISEHHPQINHNICFTYKQAQIFLTAIEPFLIVKRENVTNLLDEAGRIYI